MVGTVAAAIPRTAQAGQFMRLFVCAALCVVAAELIGPASVPLGGHASVALLPFLWALLLGTAWGLASPRLPHAIGVDTSVQALSAAVLQPALLLFIAKLGLLVGGVVPKLVASGWALAFQELGHFFGTAVYRAAARAAAGHQTGGDRRDLLRRAGAQPGHHRRALRHGVARGPRRPG